MVTKVRNANFEEKKLKNTNCNITKQKTQIVTELKNSNCDKTKKNTN